MCFLSKCLTCLKTNSLRLSLSNNVHKQYGIQNLYFFSSQFSQFFSCMVLLNRTTLKTDFYCKFIIGKTSISFNPPPIVKKWQFLYEKNI